MGINPDSIPRYPEYPAEVDPPEPEAEPVRPQTAKLREAAKALGMRYRRGYSIGEDGRRINTDNITTLYPGGMTVEEDEDGNLWCDDPLSVRQALAIALIERGAD